MHFSSELLLLISTVGSLVPLQVNQIGSVTESINAVKLAKKNGWGVMTSHRSGTHAKTLCLYGSVLHYFTSTITHVMISVIS